MAHASLQPARLEELAIVHSKSFTLPEEMPLSLRCISLSNQIPRLAVGNMVVRLSVTHCSALRDEHVGTIMESCTHLQRLDLGANSSLRVLDISSGNLKRLLIGHCQLEKIVLDCPVLSNLDLSSSAVLPAEGSDLSSLRKLFLISAPCVEHAIFLDWVVRTCPMLALLNVSFTERAWTLGNIQHLSTRLRCLRRLYLNHARVAEGIASTTITAQRGVTITAKHTRFIQT